jgi:hypothetical protein
VVALAAGILVEGRDVEIITNSINRPTTPMKLLHQPRNVKTRTQRGDWKQQDDPNPNKFVFRSSALLEASSEAVRILSWTRRETNLSLKLIR